jgi:hypothetical protein
VDKAVVGCERVFDACCLLLKKTWVIACVDKTFLVCDRVFDYSYILPIRVYLPKWDAPKANPSLVGLRQKLRQKWLQTQP